MLLEENQSRLIYIQTVLIESQQSSHIDNDRIKYAHVSMLHVQVMLAFERHQQDHKPLPLSIQLGVVILIFSSYTGRCYMLGSSEISEVGAHHKPVPLPFNSVS